MQLETLWSVSDKKSNMVGQNSCKSFGTYVIVVKPVLQMSRKDRMHMLANMFFKPSNMYANSFKVRPFA